MTFLRKVGRWSLAGLVINSVIGSSIFGLPAELTRLLGPASTLAVLIGGIATAVVMACFAEVASQFPQAGGPYLYAREAFGSFVGTQVGWFAWLTRIASAAANAALFGAYFAGLAPSLGTWYGRALVIGVVLGSVVVSNYIGVRQGATVSTTAVIARLVPLFGLIVLALPVFGVNVTATLAGLGIGGLVLAFAAQKSLENVFGGFAMLADKPLTVGDTCRIGGQLGEIEDVTLWATRLRTNERTVVSIPNGAVMAGQIENLTRRDKFWFHPTVGLDYATTPAQMRQVLENIRNLMVADPRVETEGSRARFVRLGASTLDVDVYGYVRAESYAEFLGVQEDLLLRILDIVEQAGTSVAFPTQTVHVRSGALPEEPPKKDRSPA